MSMLSAQCDELNELAEQLDWEQPEVANALRRAADNIEDLSAKCAGLMEERERMKALIGERAADVRVLVELSAENAKLRELVRDMFRDFANADNELKRYQGRTFMAVTRYAPRMRELGVEP